MPMKVENADKKVVLICAIGLMLVAALMSITSPVDDGGGPPTTYSSKSGGAKAAYLLLQELGCDVRRWSQPPSTLPEDASNYTFVIADASREIEASDKQAISRFVENGGRIVITGPIDKDFLGPKTLLPGNFTMQSWKRYPALAASEITRSAPEIEMPDRWHFSSAKAGQSMYGDDVYRSVVVRYPFGNGEVIWWSSAVPLTNAGISKSSNLELFLNSVGTGRVILFDEFFHGIDPGAWNAMKNTPLGWALFQTLLLAGAVWFTYSRRSGPVITPLPESRLSPLEFVDNLGQLYQRARATPVTVDVAMQRFHLHTLRKLGVEPGSPREAIVAALVARTKLDANEVAGTLAACESARFDTSLPENEALELVKRLQSYTDEFNRSIRKEKA